MTRGPGRGPGPLVANARSGLNRDVRRFLDEQVLGAGDGTGAYEPVVSPGSAPRVRPPRDLGCHDPPAVVTLRIWFISLPEFQNSYLVVSPKFLELFTHQPLPRLAVTVHTSFLSLYR